MLSEILQLSAEKLEGWNGPTYQLVLWHMLVVDYHADCNAFMSFFQWIIQDIWNFVNRKPYFETIPAFQ